MQQIGDDVKEIQGLPMGIACILVPYIALLEHEFDTDKLVKPTRPFWMFLLLDLHELMELLSNA
jgi:hypothetical protein